MKIAFAGKGGTGKTTIASWLGDYLARRGANVWLVDADTALSLGQASGLAPEKLPVPLIAREDLVRSRIGQGYMSLNPDVSDLPEALSVLLPLGGAPLPGTSAGDKRLLVMGTVPGAGGGCACAANALLKAVLAHLILDHCDWVLVDMEAGVEHLGRGTVASVDAVVVVSEPSLRALTVASEAARMARELGVGRQVLVLNRCAGGADLPDLSGLPGLPRETLHMPALPGLAERQMTSGSVLGLPEDCEVAFFCERLLGMLVAQE